MRFNFIVWLLDPRFLISSYFYVVLFITAVGDDLAAASAPAIPLRGGPFVKLAETLLVGKLNGFGKPASVKSAPMPFAPFAPGGAHLSTLALQGTPADGVELTITPHFIKSVWKDNKLRNRCGLLVLLPSGVNHPAMLKSKVMPDGKTYHLDILVPAAVTNPEKFLIFIRAYPGSLEESGGVRNAELRESAFHETLSTMRVDRNTLIWRRFRFVNDFQVNEDIAFSKFMTLEGCYFLYVEFLSQEKSSYMHGNGMIEGDGAVDLNNI
jgi:hypothetical protein